MRLYKSKLVLPLALLFCLIFSSSALAAAGETVCLKGDLVTPQRSTPGLPENSICTPHAELQQRTLELDLPPAAVVHVAQATLYVKADAASRQLAQLSSGEECYIVEDFVDGRWHRVVYGDMLGYIDCGAVNSSGTELEYVFSAEQSMRTLTGYSAEELDLCLYDGLSGMGEVFARAEQEYGVNALFLIAICQEESASGTSALALSRNNLAGLGGPGNWMYFDSFADCVDTLAELLSERYLNPDSSFYHGYTVEGVSIIYCGGSANWINNTYWYMENNYLAITSTTEAENE